MFIFLLAFMLPLLIVGLALTPAIIRWAANENSPQLTGQARVIDKQQTVNSYSTSSGGYNNYASYTVTFELSDGRRLPLSVPRDEFLVTAVGDNGVVGWQGTRFLGFQRQAPVLPPGQVYPGIGYRQPMAYPTQPAYGQGFVMRPNPTGYAPGYPFGVPGSQGQWPTTGQFGQVGQFGQPTPWTLPGQPPPAQLPPGPQAR